VMKEVAMVHDLLITCSMQPKLHKKNKLAIKLTLKHFPQKAKHTPIYQKKLR
jgi:hypothetical protein